MTAICAAVQKDEVAICSDSLNSTDHICFFEDKKSPKIFEINGNYIGLTGFRTMATIFEHILKNRSKAELESLICFESEVEIHGTLNKLHPILKKDYFIKTDDKDYNPTELSQLQGLIINQNGVFRFDETRSVTKHKFFAVGSGEEPALGAMYAMYNSGEHSARDIVEMGVRAASEFNMRSARGVSVNDGAIQLTRIAGANSAARDFVSPSIAPFDIATCA